MRKLSRSIRDKTSGMRRQVSFLRAVAPFLLMDEWLIVAVVYMKNHTTRSWTGDKSTTAKAISTSEKDKLRAQILPLLASSPPQIRLQLVPMLQTMLSCDFPSQWPDFFDRTNALLSTNDANSVYAGLRGLLALCAVYRFKGGDQRKGFNEIIAASFPRLLVVANGLVQETSPEAWEMMHLLLKTYKHAIFVGLIHVLVFLSQVLLSSRHCITYMVIWHSSVVNLLM